MIELSLAEIFHAAGVTWTSSTAQPQALARTVVDVSTDTRELRPGSLFIGLPGPRFNGADFARAALEAGASAVIVEAGSASLKGELEQLSEEFVAPIGACESTRAALGRVGQLVGTGMGGRTLCITGSCGKTSVKSIVAHMLRAGAANAPEAAVVASPKSFNNYIGVPRTLLLCERSTRFAVLEVGTNAQGEIADLAAIARPDVALITIIGRAHLEGLGCIEGVAHEKGALLEALDPGNPSAAAVLNADCPLTPTLRMLVPEGVPVLTFGCGTDGCGNQRHDAEHADVQASGVRATARGTEFELSIASSLTPDASIRDRHMVVPLLGDHAASNVAAALAAVIALGGDLEAALDSIPTLVAEPHRLQPTIAGGLMVIDDAYNANPESMGAAVRTLMGVERSPAPLELGPATQTVRRAPERVLVLGAMGEMGAGCLTLHREVGGIAGSSGVDRVFLTGVEADREALMAYREGALMAGLAPERIQLELSLESTIAALTCAESGLASGDICLVKASRAVGLERVAESVAIHFSQKSLASESAAGLASGGTGEGSEDDSDDCRNRRPEARA